MWAICLFSTNHDPQRQRGFPIAVISRDGSRGASPLAVLDPGSWEAQAHGVTLNGQRDSTNSDALILDLSFCEKALFSTSRQRWNPQMQLRIKKRCTQFSCQISVCVPIRQNQHQISRARFSKMKMSLGMLCRTAHMRIGDKVEILSQHV